MKIPKKVSILGQDFNVIIKNFGESFGGEYHLRNETIKIEKSLCKSEKEETFLHEITEVILAKIRCLTVLDEKIYGKYGRIFQIYHCPLAKEPHDEFTQFITILYDTLKRNKMI
jgi:hypothetical protein